MNKKYFIIFLSTCLMVSGVFLTIYVVVQQNYRLNTNDPQIEISQDAASVLNSGVSPQDLVAGEKIDLRTSLAPFMIVYDESQKPVISSAYINGQTPSLPSGVLDYVKNKGEDRITWQPQPGVRIATVINRYNSGYVLAGRSLKETEKRIDLLGRQVGLAYLCALILLLATFLFLRPKNEQSD